MQEDKDGWYALEELKSTVLLPQSTYENDVSLSSKDEPVNKSVESIEKYPLDGAHAMDTDSAMVDTSAEPYNSKSEIELFDLQDNDRPQLRTDEGRIASIQRPEPLGKAKVDGRLAGITSRRNELAVDDIIAVPFDASKSPGGEDTATESSGEGLQEQDFPIRVPLSVAEGDNNIATAALSHQNDNENVHEKSIVKTTGRPFYNGTVNSDTSGFRTSHVDDFFRSDGKVTEVDSQTTSGSVVGRASLGDNETSISALIGPTYQSSMALLEELRRRRLRFDDVSVGTGNKENLNSDHTVGAFELADNAMKASNILSSRTKKSLKKASMVLKAVEEHRSPPTDSPSTLSLERTGTQDSSISVGLGYFSRSSASLSSSRDSKDSIDKLIEARLQKNLAASSSSSAQSETDLFAAINSVDSTKQTAATSEMPAGNRIYNPGVASSAKGEVGRDEHVDNLSSFAIKRSNLSDGTYSDLSKLDEATENSESSPSIAMAGKLKSQTNGISPIERQAAVSMSPGNKFRSSSRIRGGYADLSKSSMHLTDSEIVEMHRSLGAGTVTPLPWVNKDGIRDTIRSSDGSFTTTSASGATSTFRQQESVPSFNSTGSANAVREQNLESITNDRNKGLENDPMVAVEDITTNRESVDESRDVSAIQSAIDLGDNNSKVRGIYDIRDSTGPGSTNRRRVLSGKRLVRPKSNARDPLDVYVTEESKSELSFMSAKRDDAGVGKMHTDQISEGGMEMTRKTAEKAQIVSDNQTFSSMSSESPVLSFDGQDSFHHKSSTQELIGSSRTGAFDPLVNDKVIADTDRARTDSSSVVKDSSNSAEAGRKNVRASAWTKPGGSQLVRRTNLNQLWEKFRRDFDKDQSKASTEVFEKIETLNELLTQSSIAHDSRSAEGVEFAERSRPHRSQVKAASESKVRRVRNTIRKPEEGNKGRCASCGRRDAETNCPTPVPFGPTIAGRKMEEPLLLHVWTQTTPHNKASRESHSERKIVRDDARSVSAKKRTKILDRGIDPMPEKENIPLQANFCKGGEALSNAKQPSSWNLILQEKRPGSSTKSLQRKAAVAQISKSDLKESADYAKKKKEPVFTAWFQSTRSDTSSGTVIPLSTVPKLADAYNENRKTTKMLIKDDRPKETE